MIINYFKDSPTSEDYMKENEFSPPASENEIMQLENFYSIKLPRDYVDFLRPTNGYRGKLGKSNVRFIGVERIREYTSAYRSEFFPWIIFIGTDEGNEMYVIDRRTDNLQFVFFLTLAMTVTLFPSEKYLKNLSNTYYHNDFWNSTESSS